MIQSVFTWKLDTLFEFSKSGFFIHFIR
jgi:hypothetical protein